MPFRSAFSRGNALDESSWRRGWTAFTAESNLQATWVGIGGSALAQKSRQAQSRVVILAFVGMGVVDGDRILLLMLLLHGF